MRQACPAVRRGGRVAARIPERRPPKPIQYQKKEAASRAQKRQREQAMPTLPRKERTQRSHGDTVMSTRDDERG